MLNESRRNQISTGLSVVYVIAMAIVVIYFAHAYFSQSIFFLNYQMYKKSDVLENTIRYVSNSGPDVVVHNNERNRTVVIKRETYTIDAVKYSSNTTRYTVSYPNGKQYEITDRSGHLVSDIESGKFSPQIYVNGQAPVRDRELYSPDLLVAAAYPEYQQKRGVPFLFYLSFPIFIFGWCTYRFESFQDFLFTLSLNRIWIRNGEPSDFYYLMGRVRGIIIMIGSVLLLISSFILV